jgi:hypothetical protein
MTVASTRSLSPAIGRRALLAAAGGALGLAGLRRAEYGRAARVFQATPAGGKPTTGEGGAALGSLLELVPDPYPAATADFRALAYFADIAGQLAAVGLTPPTDPAGDDAFLWWRAMWGLALPAEIAQFAGETLVQDTFGWSPFEVDRSLWFGEPPEQAMLLRGRFDAAAVEAALLAFGFVPFDVEGAVAAYTSEHRELDIADPAERFLKVSSLRNLAILPDGTFAWSRDPLRLRAIAAVAVGAPSLGDRTPVRSLLDAVQIPLASWILLPGLALQGDSGLSTLVFNPAASPSAIDDLATAIASAEAERQRMPPVGLTLLGVTAGGAFVDLQGTPLPFPVEPPPARIHAYLQFGGEADAAVAAGVIEERLATGSSIYYLRPWSEIFAGWSVSALPGQPIVLVDLDPGAALNRWLNLLSTRDLGFLAW